MPRPLAPALPRPLALARRHNTWHNTWQNTMLRSAALTRSSSSSLPYSKPSLSAPPSPLGLPSHAQLARLSTAPPQEQPPSNRLAVMWKQYGVVFLSTYFSIYCTALGTMYELVSSNLLSAGSAIDLLSYVHLDQVLDLTKIDPRAGNLAVAWILTKFTEPVRLVLAISITPRIARLVGRAPPKPPKEPRQQ
jgi:hypothetical protein